MAIEGDREDGKFRGIEVEIVKAIQFMLNPADGKLDPVRRVTTMIAMRTVKITAEPQRYRRPHGGAGLTKGARCAFW